MIEMKLMMSSFKFILFQSQFVNLNKLQKNFEQYLSLIIDIAHFMQS